MQLTQYRELDVLNMVNRTKPYLNLEFKCKPLSIRIMPACISKLTTFRLKLKPAMQSEKGTMVCVSVRIHQTYIVVIPKMHIKMCIFQS